MNDLDNPVLLGTIFSEPVYVLPDKTLPVLPIALPEVVAVEKAEKAEVARAEKTDKPAPPVVATPEKKTEKPAPAITRSVLILFNNVDSPYLKPSDEALLKKILASVQLSLTDVELLNFNNIRKIDYIPLLREKALHQLISFGVSLTELELQIPLQKYRVARVEGIAMLLADSLDVLNTSMEGKKLLWKGLQEMFIRK